MVSPVAFGNDVERLTVQLPRWSRILGAALLCAAFLLNTWRAATQSVVHDEALTYTWFLAQPLQGLLRMSANNHILYTLLAKLSVTLLGPSELSLRLPSLISGALSFVALWLLGLRTCRSPWTFLLLLALVALNPLFLDFTCAARGYGLATAGLLWGLYFAWRSFDLTSDASDTDHRRPLLWCSLSLGLSLAANLAFLFVNLGLAVCLAAVMLWTRGEGKPVFATLRSLALWLGLPGPLLAAALWAPLLVKAKPSVFYVGWQTLYDSAGEFLAASLFSDATGIRSLADNSKTPRDFLGPIQGTLLSILASAGLALLLASLFAATVFLVLRLRRNGLASLDPTQRLLLLTAVSILFAFGAHVAAHVIGRSLYPPDRAAVFLVPLLAIAWIHLSSAISSKALRRLAKVFTLTLALGIVALSASGLRATHFRTWRYDAGMQSIVYIMLADSPSAPVRVATPWVHLPALLFYRDLIRREEGTERLIPFRIELPEWRDPRSGVEYCLAHPDDHLQIDESIWHLAYHDPVSGTNLYRRRLSLQ